MMWQYVCVMAVWDDRGAVYRGRTISDTKTYALVCIQGCSVMVAGDEVFRFEAMDLHFNEGMDEGHANTIAHETARAICKRKHDPSGNAIGDGGDPNLPRTKEDLEKKIKEKPA